MTESKIILGVNTFHADSSACLIINGELIAATEEERLNRVKHYAGFPSKAISECLSIGYIKGEDITDIAFNTKPLSNLIPKGIHFLKNLSLKKDFSRQTFLKKINLTKILNQKFNLNKKVKYHFIEHHLAHIASAFYPSNFNQANGISIDGSGDFVSLAYAQCENGKINIKKKIFFPDSLGIFYHAMTQFLGFKNYGDEYKIMGLAAYGKPLYYKKILDNLFLIDKKFFKLNLEYFRHNKKNFKYIANESLIIDQIYENKLKDLFSSEIKSENFSQDFACSVQKIYEKFFNETIDFVDNFNFSKNIIFSGGCALNSSANRFLTNVNSNFKNVFINYAPGDNGGALGAAFVVASNYNLELKNTNSPYLGREFSNKYIKEILENEKYKGKVSYKFYDRDDELFSIAAKYLSNGSVIGWFQGKMEFGPRALGNRSILADPRNPNMKSIINKKIKRRESFRPFAPSVLEKYQSEWFEGNFFNPYMSSLAIVKKDKRVIVPAITHIDNTARLQSVNKNNNLRFTKLIEAFYEQTNVPILLNTSFNENEPIVYKPEEALNCILRTDIDAVFMNNFVIKKN